MNALPLVLTGIGIWMLALGIMVAALQVADFVVRALRRKAGR